MPPLISFAVLLAFCLAAVAWDARLKRIPNRLNLAAFGCGVTLSLLFGSVAGLTASLLGSLLGLGLLMVPFLLRIVGGGDVKFLAAAGAICGWRVLLPSALIAATLGGVCAVAALGLKYRSAARVKERLLLLATGSLPPTGRGAASGDVNIPYSLPIALGLISVSAARLF